MSRRHKEGGCTFLASHRSAHTLHWICLWGSIYLLKAELQRQMEGERDMGWRGLQDPVLSQAKARGQDFIWVSYVVDRNPNIWAKCCCLPKTADRELNWKWNSQDSSAHPYGIPVLQVAAFIGRSQYLPRGQTLN